MSSDRTSITLKDIARLSGVSLGTASKVINGQGNVRPEIRMRVQAVVDKLGYRPSALARSIKRNRTMVTGLIIPKIHNVFYVKIVDTVEKLAGSRGYTLVLGNSDEDVDIEIRYLRTFAGMRVDGLVLASAGRNNMAQILPELETYKRLGIPVVLVVRSIPEASCDAILLDNEAGAYKATVHALEQGHRRIAIISSPSHTSASSERIDGYLNALEDYAVPRRRDLIRVADTDPDSGYTITRQLLQLDSPPTALFVATNVPLLGTLKALRELQIRVPEDLSLICFDDPEWAPYLNPPLTAIRPAAEDLCREAMRFLFDRMTGTYTGAPRIARVPVELVPRCSVMPLR